MQWGVYVNQVKAHEWGLNCQQAMLFAVIYEAQHWADSVVVVGSTYYNLSKSKIIHELPILTDKKDTVYRLVKQLAEKGLLVCTKITGKDYFMITNRGRTWNRDLGKQPYSSTQRDSAANDVDDEPHQQLPLGQDSDLNPSDESCEAEGQSQRGETSPILDNSDLNPSVGNLSDPRKIIRNASDLNPTNTITKHTQQQHRANQFSMSLDWEPSEVFSDRCQASGLNLSLATPEILAMVFGEFKSYWLSEDQQKTQSSWEHKLLNQIIFKHRDGSLYHEKSGRIDAFSTAQYRDDTSWIDDLAIS